MEQIARKKVRVVWLLLLFGASAAYVLPRLAMRGECLSYELFSQIQEGMSRSEVLKILGDPNLIELESLPALIPKDATGVLQEVLVYYSPAKMVTARIALSSENKVGKITLPVVKDVQTAPDRR